MTEHRIVLDFCDEEFAYLKLKSRQMDCRHEQDFLQKLVDSFIVHAIHADAIDIDDLCGSGDDDKCSAAQGDFGDDIPF
jgi:hypothetical protein